MAVTTKELFESRRGGVGADGNMTLMYVVQGTDTVSEVRTAIDAAAPATFDDKYIGSSYEIELAGPDFWIVRVPYGPDTSTRRTSASATEQSFEISADTVNTQVSRETLSKTPATATDYEQLVNVETRNGKVTVRGADIFTPRYEFSLEKIYTNAFLTQAKRKQFADLVATTNAAAFVDFPIGSVLYLGSSGRKRGRGDWLVSHRFAYSPNRTNVQIGGLAAVASVPGWSYLWVTYEEEEDGVNWQLVARPSAVYVERMYDAGDFTILSL